MASTDNNNNTHQLKQNFPVRTGDVVLFDRNCDMMQFPVGWIVCKLAKERGTEYDHIGVVVVQDQDYVDKKEKKKKKKEEDVGDEEEKDEKKSSTTTTTTTPKKSTEKSSSHIVNITDDRAQVVDAIFRAVLVRSFSNIASRKYNSALAVRMLLVNDDDDNVNTNTNNENNSNNIDFDMMRNFANSTNGFPYKQRFLHFIASSIPAFPERRDAVVCLSAALLRQRVLESLKNINNINNNNTKMMKENTNDEFSSSSSENENENLFSILKNRRINHLEFEIEQLAYAFEIRLHRLQRNNSKNTKNNKNYIIGLNNAGNKKDGYFCSEISTSMLQQGDVLGDFPASTTFTPADFARISESGPFPVSRPSFSINTCLTPLVKVKPTTKNNVSSLTTKNCFVSENENNNKEIPVKLDCGEILWFEKDSMDENSNNIEEQEEEFVIRTGTSQCILICENNNNIGDDEKNRATMTTNQRKIPFSYLASPPAQIVLASSDFSSSSQNNNRFGILSKQPNATVFVSKRKVQQHGGKENNSNDSEEEPQQEKEVTFTYTSVNETLQNILKDAKFSRTNNKIENKIENSKVQIPRLYRVVEGKVDCFVSSNNNQGGGKNKKKIYYQKGDIIGLQELLARSIGLFPKNRFNGFENDLYRELMSSLTMMDGELPLIDFSLSSKNDKNNNFKLEAIDSSQLLAHFALMEKENYDDKNKNNSHHQINEKNLLDTYRLISSIAIGGDDPSLSSFRLTLPEICMLIFNTDEVLLNEDSRKALSWLLFSDSDRLISSSSILSRRIVEFTHVLRCCSILESFNRDFVVENPVEKKEEEGKEEENKNKIPKQLQDEVLLLSMRAFSSSSSSPSSFSSLRKILENRMDIGLQSSGFSIDYYHSEDDSNSNNINKSNWSNNGNIKVATNLSTFQIISRLWVAVLSCILSSKFLFGFEIFEWRLRGWLPKNNNSKKKISKKSFVFLSKSEINAMWNLQTFRSLIAVSIHSVLLAIGIEYLRRVSSSSSKESNIINKNEKLQNKQQQQQQHQRHPRWILFQLAAVTGMLSMIFTYPLEVKLFSSFGEKYSQQQLMEEKRFVASSQNNNNNTKGKKTKRFSIPPLIRKLFSFPASFKTLRWALFSVSPYVAASQWLFIHEFLLPLGFVNPAVAQSFLFGSNTNIIDNNNNNKNFNFWTADSRLQSVRSRILHVGIGLSVFFTATYPLENWRRSAIIFSASSASASSSSRSVPSYLSHQFKTQGFMKGIVRTSFAGFSVAFPRMIAQNVLSYSIFATAANFIF